MLCQVVRIHCAILEGFIDALIWLDPKAFLPHSA